MLKKCFVALWLLVPVGLLALHFATPGKQGRALEAAEEKLAAARAAEKSEHWDQAHALYAEALALLPAQEKRTRTQLRLAQAKARIYMGDLPEAMVDMEALLGEALKEKSDRPLVDEIRRELATAQYYAGWLMRLEGAGPDEWLTEVEQSRQHFRLLAEEASRRGEPAALDYQKNLEAVIRLARMDLSELQGMPLPKECSGCKNCSQRCRGQRESQAREPGEKKPEDARKGGAGKRPDGAGS